MAVCFSFDLLYYVPEHNILYVFNLWSKFEKLKIEVFQYTELDEGLNAVPASPMPPALESGVIAIKGKAVVIVLS